MINRLIYNPLTGFLSMLRRIEEKTLQTIAVILQVNLSVKRMQSIFARTWGKPTAKNINTVFFQNAKG